MCSKHYTPAAIETLINQTVRQANILPLTSGCDSTCIFCSHRNNPPQVQVLTVGERSLADIIETMSYLNPDRTITIGESASNIIEGEPTSHKDFKEIMRQLRQRFPHTPVSLTTNGHHLTGELVNFLGKIQPVYVNLSINSTSLSCHRKLMRDSEELAKCSITSLSLLNKYQIPFSCSVVGMPNITGFDDMRKTVTEISRYGADSIQIFMPGFSSFAKTDIFPDPDTIYEELKKFVNDIAPEIDCPVLLEPSCVQNLNCIVSGVHKNSPAWNAGIRKGDQILSVNDQIPYSRTDAFQMLSGSGIRRVDYIHNGNEQSTDWTNLPNGSCGITMAYDFEKIRARNMENILASAPGHILVLSSEFAFPLIQGIVASMSLPKDKASVFCVKNVTFGGTIRAAGLMCYEDYVHAIQKYSEVYGLPDALAMPCESFNFLGRDLTGHHYSEIGRRFKLPATLV